MTRYKVIADFPDSESYGIKVGQILKVGKAVKVNGTASFYPDEYFCDQYPHLFKKLQTKTNGKQKP